MGITKFIGLTYLVFSIPTVLQALESKSSNNEDLTRTFDKYYNQIPDTESKYIVNEGLSKIISSHFNGKISAFPIFKIDVKIDRTPVKIPWTLDQAELRNERPMKKKYKYVRHKKPIQNIGGK